MTGIWSFLDSTLWSRRVQAQFFLPPRREKFVELSTDKIFRALASPIRLGALRALCSGNKRLSELAHMLGVSPEQLMYHLKQLKKVQLVNQVDEFYVITELGRRVYSLVAELETSLKLAEREPLVLDGKGTPVPLRLYLQALASWVYGTSARPRKAGSLESLIDEVSSSGGDIIPETLTLLSLSRLVREGKVDTSRVEKLLSRRLGLREKPSKALELLSETRLYDFALLKLVSTYINPDGGVSLVYVPAHRVVYLRTLLRDKALPSEIMVEIPDYRQGASETLGVLAAISRFLRASAVLRAETLDSVIPVLEKSFGEAALTYPLLIVQARSSSEFTTTALRSLTQMISRGVPVLFSFQELVPSAEMLAVETGESTVLHLGACTILMPELVAKSRILGKDARDILRGLAPGIIDLLTLLKRKASLWGSLARAILGEARLSAQVSLAGVEAAYMMMNEAEKLDRHLYAYRLVEWMRELLGELEACMEKELKGDIHVLHTFFSPRETIAPEKGAGRWTVSNISPFTLAGRSFEEVVTLESRLHMLVSPATSILEVRLRELSAVQLEHALRSLERLGVRLFTITKTGLTYCEDCGNVFGGELPRCTRCQSVKLNPLVRADLLYTPSTELLPGYVEEAEARGSAERYFVHEGRL
uniref:ArsR family transcriptional regulator n=1 Tax=Thermofilum pendens TaxID=2269 RepID=A0A7C1TB48_THEPE